MASTATRLLTLISLLQRRPCQKAADLADALGVSVRQVHRYLNLLDEMGIPIYSERGPYGGFSLVRGYQMPPLMLTPEEAAAIALGAGLTADLFGVLYREAARSASAKLDNVLPDDRRSEVAWARSKLAVSGLQRVDLEALAARLISLRAALRENRRAVMLYQSGGRQQPEQRRVDPYALVFRWGWWYFVAHCHLRDGLRMFRLDRILELELLDEKFQPPVDFDVQAYLAQALQTQPPLCMTMRFSRGNAYLARSNATAWESLEELPDGGVEVRLFVPDAAWGASTALAYGPAAVVTAPPEIRRLLGEWARAAAAFYVEDEI